MLKQSKNVIASASEDSEKTFGRSIPSALEDSNYDKYKLFILFLTIYNVTKI